MTATYTQTATVEIDWDSAESIKKAERKKSRLEAAGWTYTATVPGSHTSAIVYRRQTTPTKPPTTPTRPHDT